MDRAGTVQAGQPLLQHAVDGGRQVPQLRGLEQRGHLRHVQLLGDGCQALRNVVDDVGVLVAILLRGEQSVANRLVLGATGLSDAWGATGKRVGLEGAALGAEHQLRGGAHQVASGHAALAIGQSHRKVECGTLLGAQVAVQRLQVEGAGSIAGGQHARKHNLAQLTRLHALHCGRHGGTEPVVLAAGYRHGLGQLHGVLGDGHLLFLKALGDEEVGGGPRVEGDEAHDGGAGAFCLVQGVIKGDRGHRTGGAEYAGAGGKDKVRKVRHRTSISGV